MAKDDDLPICGRKAVDPNAAYPVDFFYFSSGVVDVKHTVDVALCENEAGNCELWVVAPVFEGEKIEKEVVGWALGVGSGVFHNIEVAVYDEPNASLDSAAVELSVVDKTKEKQHHHQQQHSKYSENEHEQDNSTRSEQPSVKLDMNMTNGEEEGEKLKSKHIAELKAISGDRKGNETRREAHDRDRKGAKDEKSKSGGRDEKEKEEGKKNEKHASTTPHKSTHTSNSSHTSTKKSAKTAHASSSNSNHNHNHTHAKAVATAPQAPRLLGYKAIPPTMRCNGKLCGTAVCGRKAELLISEWTKIHGKKYKVVKHAPAFFFIDPDLQYNTHMTLLVISVILLCVVIVISIGVELCPRKQSKINPTLSSVVLERSQEFEKKHFRLNS